MPLDVPVIQLDPPAPPPVAADDPWYQSWFRAAKDAAVDVANAVWDKLISVGQFVIDKIIDLLPTDANGQVSSGWSTIESSLVVANAWAPLDFAIGLVPVYLVFLFSLMTVRFIASMFKR